MREATRVLVKRTPDGDRMILGMDKVRREKIVEMQSPVGMVTN